MCYIIGKITSATLITADGREIPLDAKAVSFSGSEEVPADSFKMPDLSFSITIPWSALRIKVGPFWMPMPEYGPSRN